MDSICANCGKGFEMPGGGAKYCGADCRGEVQGGKHLGLANPVREYRCRKLGDSIPEGFIEAFMKGVTKHGKEMPKWSWPEIFFSAAYESGRKFPLSVPPLWPGGFEDLREIMDSPEFARLMEKYELAFRYEHAGGVPVVIFSRAKD